MKRRGPRFGGLEKFGVTLEELIELGPRLVTFAIKISVPPYVYPSRARLQRLLREAPKQRRAMVRAWRIEEYARLKAEVPFLIGRHEQIDFNGDSVGMLVTAPAAMLARLSRLEHAESVEIKGIRGRRARRPKTEGVRLFSVKVRFVEQVEGQRTGLQEIEDRIVVVAARSRALAQRLVTRMCTSDQGTVLLTTGHFRRRIFEKVVDICEAPDPEFSTAGTEVYYEYRRRRLAREDAWLPVPSRTRRSKRAKDV